MSKKNTLILFVMLGVALMPYFGFADEPALPEECGTIDDYIIVNIAAGDEPSNLAEFIFAGDGNPVPIDGGNDNDCILIGDNNIADITGANGNDIIILGNNNSGKINGDGENGDDIIKTGDNNLGEISGGNGADAITTGKNNQGNIYGGKGDDTIIVGYGNNGVIDGGQGENTIVFIPGLPSANPVPGTYTSLQKIALSSDLSDSVRYTTDDTTPDCSTSTLYGAQISIFLTKTISAIGCLDSGYSSPTASFTYIIEKIEAAPLDLQTLLSENVFVHTGSASATTKVTVEQNIEIKAADSSESKVILEKNLEISRVDDEEFDANQLTSSEVEAGSLSGLTSGSVVKGALQWGIPNTGLKFNKPITVNIFVGTELSGQTLDIVRSTDGSDWTNDGIVSPTCVVANGICSFQATKASYYAAYEEGEEEEAPQSQSGGSSGGGGSIWFPQLYNPNTNNDQPVEYLEEEAGEVAVPSEAAGEGREEVATEAPEVENGGANETEEADVIEDIEKPIILELRGILSPSINESRGNLMLISEDTIVFIKTSRDYGNLTGKNVIVSIAGTIDDFTLLQITGNETVAADKEKTVAKNKDAEPEKQIKKTRSSAVSFFASIGRLISRALPFF